MVSSLTIALTDTDPSGVLYTKYCNSLFIPITLKLPDNRINIRPQRVYPFDGLSYFGIEFDYVNRLAFIFSFHVGADGKVIVVFGYAGVID